MLSAINIKFIKAAVSNCLKTVEFLIAHGANIHANDGEALRSAARCGNFKVVKFLIVHGANIHANNDYALRWSAGIGHLEVVKLLLVPAVGAVAVKHGANIHVNNDETLKLADLNGQQDVWQALSFFIQEEKLVLAAVASVAQTQQVKLKKSQRSKI